MPIFEYTDYDLRYRIFPSARLIVSDDGSMFRIASAEEGESRARTRRRALVNHAFPTLPWNDIRAFNTIDDFNAFRSYIVGLDITLNLRRPGVNTSLLNRPRTFRVQMEWFYGGPRMMAQPPANAEWLVTLPGAAPGDPDYRSSSEEEEDDNDNHLVLLTPDA